MNSVHLVAVLNLPTAVPKNLEIGDAMWANMSASTLLSTCTNPTPPAFKAHLDTLRQTQAAKRNGPAAIGMRNDALKQVRRDMGNYKTFVQQCADANEAQAATIIASAGMSIKQVTVVAKPDLAVVHGLIAGLVNARAKSRGRGVTYWWEWSLDQKAWTSTPATRVAKTSFADLTPGTTYYFRFQVLTKAGLSDWSQIVSFMVK